MKTKNTSQNANPRILIYFCNSCIGPGGTGDGLSFAHISESITSVHFKCARDVTPEHIRRGFASGADGILICGCLVRGCQNSDNDLTVLRGLYRNQMTIKSMGLAPDRLREDWVVQGTTDHLERIVAEFVEHLRGMSPVHPEVLDGASQMKESRA